MAARRPSWVQDMSLQECRDFIVSNCTAHTGRGAGSRLADADDDLDGKLGGPEGRNLDEFQIVKAVVLGLVTCIILLCICKMVFQVFVRYATKADDSSAWSTAVQSVDALEQPDGDDGVLVDDYLNLTEWPDVEQVAEELEEDQGLEGLPAYDDVLDLIVLDVDDDDLDDDSPVTAVALTHTAPEAMVSATGADCGPSAPSPSCPAATGAYYTGLGKRLEEFAPRAPLDPDNQDQMTQRLAVIERFRVHNAAQVGANAGAEAAALRRQESGTPICRICRDASPYGAAEDREDGANAEDEDPVVGVVVGPLVSPCECRGTVARVHMTCLERWLAESDSSCCELCGHQYTTIRTPSYGVLASIPAWMVLNGSAELLFDIVAFFIFTPVTLFGTHLGLSVEESPYFQISIMAALDLVYSAWLAMRLHYHANRWYSWWRRKSTVKVILDTEGKKNS